ncbi:MAG: tetratricopeptide repeat protein, partial [Deltaproteobacteria bacterium]|nr:tetratricopeptide repeat protein [Deltaproteobacteria bacterium]
MTRFIVAAFLTILIVLPSSPSTAEARSNYDEMAVRNQFWQIMEKVDSEGATKSNINALGKFVKEYRTSSVTEEAYMALGELYIEINEFSKASSMYSKILEYFPRSRFKAEALFGLGHAQYRSGHMKAAVHNLRAVLSIVNTPMALKIQANKLLKAIEGIEANIEETRTDITIAAALPFGGSYARYAEDALKGILLASDIFSKETPSIKTEIRVVEIDPDAKSYANELN